MPNHSDSTLYRKAISLIPYREPKQKLQPAVKPVDDDPLPKALNMNTRNLLGQVEGFSPPPKK